MLAHYVTMNTDSFSVCFLVRRMPQCISHGHGWMEVYVLAVWQDDQNKKFSDSGIYTSLSDLWQWALPQIPITSTSSALSVLSSLTQDRRCNLLKLQCYSMQVCNKIWIFMHFYFVQVKLNLLLTGLYEYNHYSEGGFVMSWVMTNDLICYTMSMETIWCLIKTYKNGHVL